MQRIIILIVLVFITYGLKAQNEYGVLLKTYIKDEGPVNYTGVGVRIDGYRSLPSLNGGSSGGGGDYTNVTDFETTFHDFYVFDDDFDNATVILNNSDDEGCNDRENIIYTKAQFSNVGYNDPII